MWAGTVSYAKSRPVDIELPLPDRPDLVLDFEAIFTELHIHPEPEV